MQHSSKTGNAAWMTTLQRGVAERHRLLTRRPRFALERHAFSRLPLDLANGSESCLQLFDPCSLARIQQLDGGLNARDHILVGDARFF